MALRVELSILRVESVCGANSPVAARARRSQAVGLEMLDAGAFEDALRYYTDRGRYCLLIETYNECLARALPEEAPARDYPAECADLVAPPRGRR